MDQQTVERLRERLETERGEVRRQLDDLGARRDAEGIEDPELDEGFADAGQAAAERANLLTLVRSLRDTLRDVEQALDRMDGGHLRRLRALRAAHRRRAPRGPPRRPPLHGLQAPARVAVTDPAPGAGPGADGAQRRPGKVVLVVCDSLGVGEAPDAGDYGDEGADTAGHAAAAVGGLELPTLGSWGFGRLTGDRRGRAGRPGRAPWSAAWPSGRPARTPPPATGR